MEFFYLTKISSYFGGYAVYFLGIFSYGTNVTKPSERTSRFTRIDGMFDLASIVGTLISPYIFIHLGYYGVYGMSLLCLAASTVYLIFVVAEPLKKPIAEAVNLKCETRS